MKDLRTRILTYFFVSYLPLVLLPLVVGSVVYVRTGRVVESEVVRRNLDALSRTREIFDLVYTLANDLSLRIDSNNSIMRLAEMDRATIPDRVYEVRAAQRELSKHLFRVMGFSNVYVWFDTAEVLLSLDTTYIHPSFHYGKLVGYAEYTYGEWRNHFMETRFDREVGSEVALLSAGREATVLSGVQSIPVRSPGQPSMTSWTSPWSGSSRETWTSRPTGITIWMS
ncbi:MAG: hypothetical protein ACOC2N_06830 [Spirochaetota bacterium]